MKIPEPYILYAEDEETDAILFERAFRRAGITHKMVIVADGQAAIDYLSDAMKKKAPGGSNLPCVALLDIHMPSVSGFEVLRWIRTTPSVHSVVTIMFSSSENPIDVRQASALGANGYLVKPAMLEECVALARTLKEWLTQFSVGTQLPPSFAQAHFPNQVIATRLSVGR